MSVILYPPSDICLCPSVRAAPRSGSHRVRRPHAPALVHGESSGCSVPRAIRARCPSSSHGRRTLATLPQGGPFEHDLLSIRPGEPPTGYHDTPMGESRTMSRTFRFPSSGHGLAVHRNHQVRSTWRCRALIPSPTRGYHLFPPVQKFNAVLRAAWRGLDETSRETILRRLFLADSIRAT